MFRTTPTNRRLSNAAATLAALALTFGFLLPRPCLCLGCEATAGPEKCCCQAGESCCETPSTHHGHHCQPAIPADGLYCDGCSCNSAPEPTTAISVVVAHEDFSPAPAAMLAEPPAIAAAESINLLLAEARLPGGPPGMRLHALYSVWLN